MNSQKTIRPAVCIPIHTSKLNKYEIISIRSHVYKLKDHDIFILIPESKKDRIVSVLKKNQISPDTYKIHQVRDIYLSHSDNYQILMLSPKFYNFYKSYTHILIAQMDAYTFSDQLISWCEKKWDYIGAPLFFNGHNWSNDFWYGEGGGVGGFSLRSIKKTLEVLNQNPTIYKFDDFILQTKYYNFKGKFILFLKYIATKVLRKDKLRKSFITSTLDKNLRRLYIYINEDLCYSYYLPKYLSSFKVADFDDSIKFSIDGHVNESLEILDFVLPFGAHAWFTNQENLIAWDKYIN